MADASLTPKKRAPTLYFIIGIKLLKGTLALFLAFGLYHMAGQGLGTVFDRLMRFIHLDPENRFLSYIGDNLDAIKPKNARWFATGTFFYSLFSLVEGVGLIFRAPWAGWLAIGESAFFIPIEIFELVHHHEVVREMVLRGEEIPHSGFTWKVSVILGLNILIVWYLLQNRARLFRHH